MKLTDSQLVTLSGASRRENGAVLPLPKSLKLNAGAVTIVLKSLLKNKLVIERAAEVDAAAWREDQNGRRFALAITPAGLEAIGVEALPVPKSETALPAKAARKEPRVTEKAPPATKPENKGVREGSKLAVLVDLMRRKTGATIEEAVKATGWQQHSVRGAISGALKKKMGLAVTSSTVDGRGRVYRIAAS